MALNTAYGTGKNLPAIWLASIANTLCTRRPREGGSIWEAEPSADLKRIERVLDSRRPPDHEDKAGARRRRMKAQSGFYGWKLLAATWIIVVANCGFPLMGASVANPYMAVDLHFSRSTLGFAFGVFQWMGGLPGPLVALCVNKRGARFTLLLGSLLLVAGSILMAQFVRTSIQVVIVFGVVVGLGFITGGPLAAQPCIARWFVDRRALAISLLLTGGPIGAFVAPPVLTWLIQRAHGNWHAAWWLIAALGAVSALMAALFVKESPAAVGQLPDGASAASLAAAAAAPAAKRPVFRTTEEWTFAEVLRTPALWLILISALGVSAAYYLFLAHGVMHLRDLGYSPAQAAASFSVLALFQLLGMLLVAALGDRIEPRLIMAMSLLVSGLGMMMALKPTGPAGPLLMRRCPRTGVRVKSSLHDDHCGQLLWGKALCLRDWIVCGKRLHGRSGRIVRNGLCVRPLRQLRYRLLCILPALLYWFRHTPTHEGPSEKGAATHDRDRVQ